MKVSNEVTKKFLNIAYDVSKLIDKEEELQEWAIPLINTSIQEILCNDLDEAIKTFEKVIEMVQEFMKNPEKWKDTMATQSRMGNKLVNIDECVKYDEENVTEISEDDRYSHINVSDGIKYCVPDQDVLIWDEYDEDYRLINRHTNKHQDEREGEYHDDYYDENNMDNTQREVARIDTDWETRRLGNATRRKVDEGRAFIDANKVKNDHESDNQNNCNIIGISANPKGYDMCKHNDKSTTKHTLISSSMGSCSKEKHKDKGKKDRRKQEKKQRNKESKKDRDREKEKAKTPWKEDVGGLPKNPLKPLPQSQSSPNETSVYDNFLSTRRYESLYLNILIIINMHLNIRIACIHIERTHTHLTKNNRMYFQPNISTLMHII